MKNVSKKLVRSLVIASTLLVSTFSTQAALVLSFEETDIQVNLNDTFTVDLYVETETLSDSIMTWGLDAVFDNGVIALNSFDLSSDFMPGFTVDGDGIAGVAAIPSGIFGSDILLGTFEFLAVGSGVSNLATANTFGDIFEGFTTVDFFNPAVFNSALADITVTDNSSGTVDASAPATLSLFALAGLVLMRLKRLN